MPLSSPEAAAITLPFEKFWGWLQAHHNCILRAGTPDVLLFDHDDYHWHLAQEDETMLLVQVVRGKDLVGELVVIPSDIAYVQAQPNEHDEFIFECVIEAPHGRDVAYHFVMAHSYDEAEPSSARRWTH